MSAIRDRRKTGRRRKHKAGKAPDHLYCEASLANHSLHVVDLLFIIAHHRFIIVIAAI